jgi:hypothetical protein
MFQFRIECINHEIPYISGLDERSVRQNASTCVEVDKHTEQYGWGSASDLGSGNAFSTRNN